MSSDKKMLTWAEVQELRKTNPAIDHLAKQIEEVCKQLSVWSNIGWTITKKDFV